ncbi:GNAT family N-acetyltransferase [Flavihumibacter rivuli]|uniref:aminoglycoside 6'-N-acetyltransferase n=1 Tax=Flavihumibacter rivuli TaxID=2838156 RepID=UPI001BDEE286|nr:aminoglycoside 6'-N-acetyltransferase [Flavihumibacter rivuli]ULQ55822.1 GNAT family N-acetyltransferase [Flavihumibacter rivuli]
MTIEKLSPHNLQQLLTLVLELWTDCSLEEETPYYTALMNAPDELCLLAKEGDHYVGFLHLSTRKDYVEGADELPIAYIEGIYVQPHHQHKGIARRLVSAGEEWARQMGLKQLASDTEWNNTSSIAFHQQIGFHEAGRIVCFIKSL